MDYIEVSAKTVDDAITEACQKFLVTSDKLEYIVVEEGTAGFLGLGSKPATIKARVKSSITDTAIDFLKNVFEAMNMVVAVSANYNEEERNLDIDLNGDDKEVFCPFQEYVLYYDPYNEVFLTANQMQPQNKFIHII